MCVCVTVCVSHHHHHQHCEQEQPAAAADWPALLPYVTRNVASKSVERTSQQMLTLLESDPQYSGHHHYSVPQLTPTTVQPSCLLQLNADAEALGFVPKVPDWQASSALPMLCRWCVTSGQSTMPSQ